MPEFTRQYNTPSGLVEIKITYQPGVSAQLDFDVVEDIELGYGYEDEDQLTFYPNTCRIVFDDFKKTNYDILKLSLGTYANTLPENKMTYGGVEIKLNGATKFKGYIDELTLNYDEEKLETSFEALDLTMQLRDMNVDRDKIIWYDDTRILDSVITPMQLMWYGIYKQIWQDFSWQVYDTSFINTIGLHGTFIKHDWIFKGIGIYPASEAIKNWNNPQDFNDTGVLIDSTEMFSQNRPCRTWADYIKLIALHYGAIIGTMDYGKVYFIKRFGHQTINPIDVSDKIIDKEFTKKTHLKVLRGTVIKNHWQGERLFEYGNVERTSNGDFKYEDKIKTIDTYITSYNEGNFSGTAIFTWDYPNNRWIPVFHGVKDPNLGSEAHIAMILANWQRENRIKSKDIIEC
jgi:hypothetical protein